MQIGSGEHRYHWHEDWARIPETPAGRNNGRTHGVAALDDGRVVVFAQTVPAVLFYNRDGELVESWGDRFVGAHGLTVSTYQGQETLWLVDEASCEVCHVDLKGDLIQRLTPPPFNQRPDGRFTPTWADVNPANGDLWVADGYGGSAVFRYNAAGDYLGRLTGEEGAGRFSCPHALRFGPDGRLYIADRGNHRLTLYDAEGQHLRHDDDATHSPCGFDFRDQLILVPELNTGVKLLDHELNVVAELGAATWPSHQTPEGWPNVDRETLLQPGHFNSPHDACFGPDGDIFVVEWIVGGRITRLEKI
jgi:DNA-binding beta-propeller fold protein YncE